jgi:hypothetical protein
MRTCSNPEEAVGVAAAVFVASVDLSGASCRRRITRESILAPSKITAAWNRLRAIERRKAADIWLSSMLPPNASPHLIHRRAIDLNAELPGVNV